MEGAAGTVGDTYFTVVIVFQSVVPVKRSVFASLNGKRCFIIYQANWRI
jgi:hypothetical protein